MFELLNVPDEIRLVDEIGGVTTLFSASVVRVAMPRVRNKGRVVIPESVRTALGIEPGDEVRFEETDAGYVLRKEDPQPSEGGDAGVE